MSSCVRDEMQAPEIRVESSFPKVIGKPYAGNPHVQFEREGLP
jgi:hypothetical protein